MGSNGLNASEPFKDPLSALCELSQTALKFVKVHDSSLVSKIQLEN